MDKINMAVCFWCDGVCAGACACATVPMKACTDNIWRMVFVAFVYIFIVTEM